MHCQWVTEQKGVPQPASWETYGWEGRQARKTKPWGQEELEWNLRETDTRGQYTRQNDGRAAAFQENINRYSKS